MAIWGERMSPEEQKDKEEQERKVGLFVAYSVPSILTLINIPLLFRMIPHNAAYGVRVRETMENPAIWFDVNQVVAAISIVSCLLCLAIIYYVENHVSLKPMTKLHISIWVPLAIILAGLGIGTEIALSIYG